MATSKPSADDTLAIIHGAIGEAVANMAVSPTVGFGNPSSAGVGDTVRLHSTMSPLAVTLPLSEATIVQPDMKTAWLQAVSDMLHKTDVLHWDNDNVRAQHMYQVRTMMTMVHVSYRDAFLGTLEYQAECPDEMLIDNYGARQYLFEGIVKAIQEKRETSFARILSTIDIELEKRHEQYNDIFDPEPTD